MGDAESDQGIAAGAGSNVDAHDLLADIFGGSIKSASESRPIKNANPVDDIMSLFGTSNIGQSTSKESSPRAVDSLASPTHEEPTIATPKPDSVQSVLYQNNTKQAGLPKSALQQYTAYEKNDLKITLMPKTNSAQPGMVQILVRFNAVGAGVLENVNFQAAVPKVSLRVAATDEQDVLMRSCLVRRNNYKCWQ